MNSVPGSENRRQFLKTAFWGCAGAGSAAAVLPKVFGGDDAARITSDDHLSGSHRLPRTEFQLSGWFAAYLANVTEQWLKVAPFSNPAMLAMFQDRDRLPRRDMVPWAGEFAGKYLTAAVLVHRLRPDAELQRRLSSFVNQLVAAQAEDGYLGPWPKENRLTGQAPNAGATGGPTWDAWGHYHIMIGLLLWHEDTGDASALACVQKMGDLICQKFAQARLVDTGSTEMNLAVIHSLCLLYKRTTIQRYLRLAQQIRDEFALKDARGNPLAGDYLNCALAGQAFYQMPKPRWESLHPIMGLAELFWITGEDRYRRAFEHIWWSIVQYDRHNNGGFSSGEQAQGNPYHLGAIETCCTVAWVALSVEMLKLTANSVVADELELSTFNSVLGLHSPAGRWVTYNTPMDGVRKASAHDIVFQARAGSPELNCCSVNGARGLGMVSDWALMQAGHDLLLSWYGPSTLRTKLPSGATVTLRQQTDYPRGNRIQLFVEPESTNQFCLRLRIPYWSRSTLLKLNGKPMAGVAPGTYFNLDRLWQRGDTIELNLDFSLHYWLGDKECAGKTSVYRGPILLTYDRRFNTMDPNSVPELDAATLAGHSVKAGDWLPPFLLWEVNSVDGQPVRLCDFASAGMDGGPYRSWLPIKNVARMEFSQSNPLRSVRGGSAM